ncbi:MAG: hypothetical protein FJ118_09155 [Deltaproteobacteria bacterium]|nr:hypothetical protein [Deltaproteobacteria bacterium]
MPKKRQEAAPKPLLELLQQTQADSNLKTRCFHLLRSNLSRVKSPRDFERLYDGLFACITILGPQGDAYLKTLDRLRRTLDSAAAEHERAGGWMDLIVSIIQNLVPHMVPDLWARIRPGWEKVLDRRLPKHPKEEKRPPWKI